MEDSEPVESLTPIVPTADLLSQVQIANTFPRKLGRFTARAIEMATTDQESAGGCFYVLKRKDKRSGETKKITGPSIRLAEICVHCFGNLRWGGRTMAEEERHVVLQGVAHDLENNVLCNVEVKRRITTSEGRRYGEDMVTVTSMAGIAICMRNAAFKIIPAYLWKPVYEAAMAKAVGDASTLADRRQKMVAAYAKMGVGIEKILAYCDKKALEEITLEDLADLIGAFNSIRENEQTIDEVFAPKADPIGQPLSNAEAATRANGSPESAAAPPSSPGEAGASTPTPPAADPSAPPPAEQAAIRDQERREAAQAQAQPEPPKAGPKVNRQKVWTAILGRAKKSSKTAGTVLTELVGHQVSGLAALSDAEVLEIGKKLGV